MIGTWFTIFLVLCALALISWGINSLPLPPVIRVIAWVLLGLSFLYWLSTVFHGGHVAF